MDTLSPSIEVRGELLNLLPNKMIWWAARKTLFVADTHFGKASTFRQAGIPVPNGTTRAMLSRLTDCIESHRAERLIILGDFVHSSTRSVDGYEAELVAWRMLHEDLELLLVKGNHDRGHDTLFSAMNLRVIDEPLLEEPFALCHYHSANDEDSFYALAGHVHPAIKLGGQLGRNPCFYFTDSYALLPSFGEFTGCENIKPQQTDRVFMVAEEEVVEVTKLALAKR